MERASSGWAAFSPDNAIMEFDNAFAHRQAKAETIDLSDQAGIHTVEAIEDAPKLLGGNTQAMIAHTDFEDAPCFPRHRRSTLAVCVFGRCLCFVDLAVHPQISGRQQGVR